MRFIYRFLFAFIVLSSCITCFLFLLPPYDAAKVDPQLAHLMQTTQLSLQRHSESPTKTMPQPKSTTVPSTTTTRKPLKLKKRTKPTKLRPSKPSSQQTYRKRCWKSGYSPTSDKPINHTPGDFLINENRLCSGHITLLVIVHSEMGARRRRDLARSTWASLNSVNGHRLAVVFVVGYIAGDDKQQAALRSESAETADLVQVPCQPDGDPSSSACKALYSLVWVNRHCKGVKFLLKVNDHVFVNVFHLANLVTGRLAGAVNTFYCRTADKEGRIGLPHLASYVSHEEWPADLYPLHCDGLAYLMSADLVPHLLKCAAWRNYLRLENVFITGVLGQALGAKMVNWKVGWGSEWLHPKHNGPAVTGAIILASQEGVPLPSLQRSAWRAARMYSADFV